jgi:hypothetical protein
LFFYKKTKNKQKQRSKSKGKAKEAANNEPILMPFLGEILNKVENAAKETTKLLTFCLILFFL